MHLCYKRTTDEFPLMCYVDADWGGDLIERKSTSGFLIKVYGNTIAWVTKKQNCVALSTTEAELISLCSAVQELKWFRRL